MSLAWLLPGSLLCMLCGWLAVMLFCLFALSTPKGFKAAYLGGMLLYLIGFHWLFQTIRDFGGFSNLAAGSIFSLFVSVSALQFPFWLLLFHSLPRQLDQYGLRTAFSWVLAEFIFIRIFPWCAAHTQLAFQPLVQIAEIGGVPLITLLMFWTAESLIRLFRRELKPAFFVAPALLCLSILFGIMRIAQLSMREFPKQSVALLQANISTEDKHNVRLFRENTQRYRELSAQVTSENTLVIWPEAVIQDFIPAKIGQAKLDARLPEMPAKNTSFLIGSLSFDSREKFYNSALAIYPDGRVPYPYHKQILMPFGEYTPFSELFPWIKEIHATPDFTAGTKIEVFDYAQKDGVLRLSPLICYEDVLPSLARQASLSGANLLVNLTNDAWFGRSVAPYQHNLIASFRAIENRRYLLRSTNSGLTAIINPMGITEASLPIFSEGILQAEVALISDHTLYSAFFGDSLNWLLLIIWVVCLPALARGRREAS